MSETSPKSFAHDPTAGKSEPREVDWLLTDADWIVTCDDQMRCIASGAVAMDNGAVVAVGPTDHIASRFTGRRCMNMKGFLIFPGLVNTHTHAAMSCLRGIGDDLPLDRWLHEVIFPAEASIVSSDMVYWGTLLSIVEMLKNGITTFCDGYFFEESAARACEQAGIRAVLGQGVLDFPAPDQPVPGHSRERVETFLDLFPKGNNRVRPSLFCHAPYTCGPETLQWVKAMCRKEGMLFQIHLSETAAEVKELERKVGKRPTFYLDDLGILDSQTLCAHAVWLDTDEIELLAARRVSVSHNAESNMKLGSGVARVPEMLSAGVAIGLGTDGCASNNDLDLFSEMDRVSKLHKVFHRDPVTCPAPQVLHMATLGGASALHWQDEIGSLEEGKKADLVAVDLNQPHLTPLYDPVSQLVYAAKGSDVRHVWVDGQLVVHNGEVLSVDTPKIMAEARRIALEVTL